MPTRRSESDPGQLDAHPAGEVQNGEPSESPAVLLERACQYIRDVLALATQDEATELIGVDAAASPPSLDRLRTTGQLIGFPDHDGEYRYPAFQLDPHQRQVHPVVAHANRALRADIDPYGAASWWLTPTDILDGNTPLDDLTHGTLTLIAVDSILVFQRSGM